MNLPVVAVVATAGEDRLVLLTERALPSIARQTSQVDLVVVVSDNDPLSDHLEEDDVTRCFGVGSNVRLILNSRTRGNSGTGAWNTGIYAALEAFGEDCWVAILDDDDEWKENHIELCLRAANEKSQWIASGLIRCSLSGRKNETFPTSKPSAKDFFAANPGVQGSNLFVRVGSLLGAGLFDEALPSTTDRDLCIRLCDLLEGSDDWYSHTAEHTVIHYADDDRARVSSRGSTAKTLGLKRFYYKYAARMSANQRKEFKDRAANLFDCGEEEFNAVENWVGSVMKLETWSGDTLPLNNDTVEALPKLQAAAPPGRDKDKTVVFGLITSNIFRIVPLLNDLSTASRCGAFDPFIVIFANSVKEELTTSIESELKKRKVQFYLLSRKNRVVNSILKQCNDTEMPPDEEQLPIAMSRTVLQVFIHQNILPLAESKRFDRIIDAVVIMDDDKRLPKDWSPFARSDADIAIGRDLRTPPNPSIFSLRTNLIDFIYNLDLAHMKGADQDEVRSYCLTQTPFDSKFDWYYDLSSSRMDHLEQPVYQANAQLDSCRLGRLLHDFLVGTPLCRDVLPLESGPTEQRGGCMVIMNRDGKSFEPLAGRSATCSVNYI